MISYVYPLQGTASSFSFSNGNTLPFVALPFGMTHWTPQTQESGWIYAYHDHHFQGIRATHQPSPWMGDYGHLTFMPQTGRVLVNAQQRASSFRHSDEITQPNYYSVYLRRYETTLEITPTARCAVIRLTFPSESVPCILMQPFEGEASIQIIPDSNRVLICSHANHGGVAGNFGCYYWIESTASFSQWGTCIGDATSSGNVQVRGEKAGAHVEFAQLNGEYIELRIGTSFISFEQAKTNLQHEIGDYSFDEVKVNAESTWNNYLNRVQIQGGTETQQRTFYTALYRSLLFPRVWHEYDGSGQPHHFSPYDGQVHSGVLYADNGFWDTHRTVYSLLSILFPKRLGEILEGWLNAYRESGWLPKWASPGHRNCMIGTHIDVIFADAISKGITGFDYQLAYKAVRKNATHSVPDDAPFGRIGLKHYLDLGYVPADQIPQATSRTLDFAYGDFAVAQIAERLGHANDAMMFRGRAQNYRNVFDASTGFMRGRNSDGTWQTPFNPTVWGGPFVEGSAWQHTWNVPHDPDGLIQLMGNKEAFVARLDEMMRMSPVFDVGTYGFEIHEMSEMAAVDFGQYAHSNQPVHHVLYLYSIAGRPDKTKFWVHKVLTELYAVTPDGLPGDEDNGEMSAWYVLSALGLYPLCLGSTYYIRVPSLFKQAHLQLTNGSVCMLTNDMPIAPLIKHSEIIESKQNPQ